MTNRDRKAGWVEAPDSNRDTLISALIHTRYSVDREIALLRQKERKPAELEELGVAGIGIVE